MTSGASPASGVAERRLATPESAVVALVAAAAWTATVAWARGMPPMGGTAGLDALTFLPAWTLMMAAMMLPAVGVTGSIYAHAIATRRSARLAGFVAGYLLVWTLSGVPAFGLAWLGGDLGTHDPAVADALAVVLFAICGIYQLTPMKDRCLSRCRSPFGLVMKYGSFRGWSRDLRVGVHHGAYCLACCWALMLALVVVGVMNLLAMVGLAILVTGEKVLPRGAFAGRLAGLAALGFAAALVWMPSLAPGLHPTPMMH